jgi:hypothetical protein
LIESIYSPTGFSEESFFPEETLAASFSERVEEERVIRVPVGRGESSLCFDSEN